MSRVIFLLLPFTVLSIFGCVPAQPTRLPTGDLLIPAEEFSKSVREGRAQEFSIFEVAQAHEAQAHDSAPRATSANTAPEIIAGELAPPRVTDVDGDPRFLEQGLILKRSGKLSNPEAEEALKKEKAQQNMKAKARARLELPVFPSLPPGSSAPYLNGQMRPNPSLWPDEGYGAALYRDARAFQAMDVITIVVKEAAKGTKKAETDAESKFSLKAAIENLFGVETKDWASNNASLDPANLINATTESKYEGTGETKREGSLNAKISAVIMEVLPNELLRVEGSKIVSVNNEEEIMVISGLLRPRDIDATNQVDSSRIANMRIDFYGRGVVAENQEPGWLARILRHVWPF